jgi:hypothetical protein
MHPVNVYTSMYIHFGTLSRSGGNYWNTDVRGFAGKAN